MPPCNYHRRGTVFVMGSATDPGEHRPDRYDARRC